MQITPVNNNFLVEPILRTAAETDELRKRAGKSGLLIAETKPDNKNKFEGIPNTGTIRYLPESYKGELKVGMHVVFAIDKPNGIKHEGVALFAIKQEEIVAVFS